MICVALATSLLLLAGEVGKVKEEKQSNPAKARQTDCCPKGPALGREKSFFPPAWIAHCR